MMIGVLTAARPHSAAFSWVPVETVTVAPPAPPVVPPFCVEKPTWPLPLELEPPELLDEDELDEELPDDDELLELLEEELLEDELLELDDATAGL